MIRARAQSLVEYALILALIALIVIVAIIFLGGVIANIFNKIGQSV